METKSRRACFIYLEISACQTEAAIIRDLINFATQNGNFSQEHHAVANNILGHLPKTLSTEKECCKCLDL
jgi:hypothetical protein